jgi:hypothetical protein
MTKERKDEIFEILCDFFRDCFAGEERKDTLENMGIAPEEIAELGLF